MGHSRNSFIEASVVHKTGCVVSAIFASRAGGATHRQHNRKESMCGPCLCMCGRIMLFG